MKTALLSFLSSLLILSAFPQQTQYQTYTSVLKISASKEGEIFQWENKNITVRLDYKTGDFITRLKNIDFQYSEQPVQSISDTTSRELEYTFTGNFPIHDILNQKQINQNYTVELQLNNDELSLRKTILFDMTITRPSSGEGSYRVFSLHGKLYNDQLQLPAFEGFDDEIEIWLAFNGYMNTR